MKKWCHLLCYRRYVVSDLPHPFTPLPPLPPLAATHRAAGWVCSCTFRSEGDPGPYSTGLQASSVQTTVLWSGTQSRQVPIFGAEDGEESWWNQGVCARPYMEEIRLLQEQVFFFFCWNWINCLEHNWEWGEMRNCSTMMLFSLCCSGLRRYALLCVN